MKCKSFVSCLVVLLIVFSVAYSEGTLSDSKNSLSSQSNKEIIIEPSASDRISTQFIQLFDCKSLNELNTKVKKAKFAVLVYNEVLAYFDSTNNSGSKEALISFAEEAVRNGKVFIGSRTRGVINVCYYDNARCMIIDSWPTLNTIMFMFLRDIGENGTMGATEKIDISELQKYFEMEPKEILIDMD